MICGKYCVRIKVKKNTIASAFWGLAIAAYMFQCYWRECARLIVPSLAVFLALEIRNIKFKAGNQWMKAYLLFFLYLSSSFGVSCLAGTTAGTALRFYLILLVIPLATCIKESGFEKEWMITKVLAVIKAGTVLITWLDVFIKQNYIAYRAWAQTTGAGDIYIINGIPRVQILGTSIFVLLFVCEYLNKKGLTAFGVVMLLTALAAGNSAYVLGIVFFLTCYYFPILIRWLERKNWRLIFFIPLAVALLVVFGKYSIDSMKLKADVSNAVRIEQIEVLTNTNPVFGSGLGHHVSGGGRWRNYNGDTYFELQTLYIYNQVGIVGLLAFYVLTVVPYTGKKKRLKLVAYLTYLLYTFFNPYCFDSTHIFAVVMISNLIPEVTLDRKSK